MFATHENNLIVGWALPTLQITCFISFYLILEESITQKKGVSNHSLPKQQLLVIN